MSAELNALFSGQRDIHGRIARLMDNLRKLGAAGINLSAIETRMKILDQLWVKFEAQHELIRACYKEKYNESEYATEFFDAVENTYVQQRSKLSEQAERYKTVPSTSASSNAQQRGERSLKTSLPKIKLPPFSGTYENWPSFRDLFQSVIGENSAVTNIERFHYLRSCLQGPAEKLIRPLAVTGENYERAWAILKKHFENKKELIRCNFAAFTAVTKMRGETAEELSRVYHAVTTAVNAQESIGRPIKSHGMDLFNHLIVELFDPRTRLEWESSTSDSFEPPDHDTLLNFITKRMLTLNAAKPTTVKVSGEPSKPAKSHFVKYGSNAVQCAMCNERHAHMMCGQFKAKPVNERRSFVESHRLCYNCLGNHPVARCQSTKNCWSCKGRHHSMLHDAYANSKTADATALSAIRRNDDRKAILLATARVLVADRSGELHSVRVLIDQGSEVSIITESLVQRMRLQRNHSSVTIFGIGGSPSGATRGKVALEITSRVTGETCSVVAFVLPRLSSYRSSTPKQRKGWPHIKGGPQAPMAQNTILGWILSGGCSVATLHDHFSSLQCTADHDLTTMVHRFWEQEEVPLAPTALAPEEERCENFFVQTHTRLSDGRYVVRLPFVTTPMNLGETRKSAERLLSAMERKSSRDSSFGDLYRSFMLEYEQLKHMNEISSQPQMSTATGSATYHITECCLSRAPPPNFALFSMDRSASDQENR